MDIFTHGFLLILLAFHSNMFQSVQGDNFQDLYAHVKNNYNNEIIPRCLTTKNLTVSVGAALREIIDINEVEQMVKVKLWMRLNWMDCYIIWNSTDYGGITNIAFTSTELWTPDITLYQSANEGVSMPGEKKYLVSVFSDGSVVKNFPTTVTFSCSIDVSYFPYDTQNCSLSFGSWTQHGQILDIVKKTNKGDLSSFLSNNEWEVVSMDCVRNVLYYGCCPEPYPDVTFHLIIKRKPIFYFVTLIFPCMLVLALAAIGFVLPAESGEKMSLQITVLLSLAVFLLIMSDKLPAAADNFPIVGIYFAVSMALVTISCLLTVLVLWMHFRDGSTKRVPAIIRRHCLKTLDQNSSSYHRKDVSMKENSIQPKSPERETALAADKMDSKSIDPQLPRENVGKTIDDEMIRKEWSELARVSDRVILIFYILTSTITSSIFIGVLASHE